MTSSPPGTDASDAKATGAAPASDTLDAALARHGIDLPPAQVKLLGDYCKRLWAWNERLNLTRHTTYEKFVARDVVDSMQLAALIEPKERVLDVGAGGGVPGAVIAVLRPDCKVTLSDSVAKKAKACEAIVREAGIRAKVHHGRAETLLDKKAFDTLVIRAVAPLEKLLTWFKPHWDHIGRLLIIKGPNWAEERGVARHSGLLKTLDLRKAASYPLTGTESESVILEVKTKDKMQNAR